MSKRGTKNTRKLLNEMTMVEKCAIVAGQDNWQTLTIERLGIPPLVMTDGPHAVCAWSKLKQGKRVPVTFFPTGTAISATWNPALVRKLGEALGEETRAHGYDIILGPCVNIIRTPLAGRNFEGYGEDPCLTGCIGVDYVKGVQSRGVGTSLKHYACNNQEIERFRSNSELSERALREIYLPHFERIVKEAQPWTVMCAYNRVNGEHASRNRHLLTEILRDEWGFRGIVVSDWGAVHDVFEPIKAGLDLEMPGPPKFFGPLLADAVRMWHLEEADVDAAVLRILRLLARSGKLNGRKPRKGSVNTPAHQAVARRVAEESITLLKNEGGVLPLKPRSLKTLAVIGPCATDMQVGGGGSSSGWPKYRVTPLQGLKRVLGRRTRIRHARGCENTDELPLLKAEINCVGGSIRTEYFTNSAFRGRPALVQTNFDINIRTRGRSPGKGVPGPAFAVRWTAALRVTETATYRLRLGASRKARVLLDGKQVLSGTDTHVDLDLVRGHRQDLRVEFVKHPADDAGAVRVFFGISPDCRWRERIRETAELAAKSDAAVVCVGMPRNWEGEGHDRPHMGLPGHQDALVKAVVKANPNTVVLVNAGAPVAMPWADAVPGILWMYYPGMEGGTAAARILCGKVNPSGKLPFTLPKRLKDNPSHGNYPGKRTVHYEEGIYVGYRYYDDRGIDPLFPFGHGLSCTTFEYSRLTVPKRVKRGASFRVAVTVRNTGKRAGQEIVQFYIADPSSSVDRPPRELKAFKKVRLKPGQSRRVSVTLTERDLSFYSEAKQRWVAEAGAFIVMAASSSRDLRLQQRFRLV